MKSLILSTFMFFVLIASANAEGLGLLFDESDGGDVAAGYSIKVGAFAGQRTDNLDWNIAGNISGANPNVLSELKWKDIATYQGGINLDGVYFNEDSRVDLAFKGLVAYGITVEGSHTDEDWLFDDRTGQFGYSDGDSDEGSTLDFEFKVGPQVKLLDNKMSASLLAGVQYHNIELTMTSGEGLYHDPSGGVLTDPSTWPVAYQGPLVGLDSSYEATMFGPSIGIDVDYDILSKLKLGVAFDYYFWTEYEAEANWNLRTDFAHPVSFEHFADDATGFSVEVDGEWRVTDKWSVTANYKYSKWDAGPGKDTTYFADDTEGDTQLNAVNWDTQQVNVGITYRFD